MGDLTQASAPSCGLDVISTLHIKTSRIRKGECLTQSSCVLERCEPRSPWVQQPCTFYEASVIWKSKDCMEDQETCAQSLKLSEPHFFHLQKEGLGLDELKDTI